MEKHTVFPDSIIVNKGIISKLFLELNIKTFRDACLFVLNLPYGYNSLRDDVTILFKDGYGTCTTKHAVIATLAEELAISILRMLGIYAMDEHLVTGAERILAKYKLPYVPMIHCFLDYMDHGVDLTEGNHNGKNHPIEDFLYTEKVPPNISEKEEYLLYRKALQERILMRTEMHGISMADVLRARLEGVALLGAKVSQQ
jgi:hypothetical protein